MCRTSTGSGPPELVSEVSVASLVAVVVDPVVVVVSPVSEVVLVLSTGSEVVSEVLGSGLTEVVVSGLFVVSGPVASRTVSDADSLALAP